MSEWISIKKQLPPYGIFVEVILGKETRLNSFFRCFAALWDGGEDEGGIFWSRDGYDERDHGKFGITHWRHMRTDIRGRTPILFASKRGFLNIKWKKIIAKDDS